MNDLRCISFDNYRLYEDIKLALETILFKNFEFSKDVRKYIEHIFVNKLADDGIIIYIYKDAEYIYVEDAKYAIKMYIYYKLSIQEFIKFPSDIKRIIGVTEVFNSIINLSKEINEFIAYFTLLEYDYDRETMIKFIKKYKYIPITHSFFGDDEYIYQKEDGKIYDENGYLFEDWYSEGPGQHNGIRMRKGGNWIDSWHIKQFDGWFDKMSKFAKTFYQKGVEYYE